MSLLAAILFVIILADLEAQSNVSNKLTMENAEKNGIENNPELQYLLKNIDANKAIKIQSGLISNPELGLEAENILGSGELSGFNGSEITATLSQNFQLAGKISKREKVAEIDISLAEWDYYAKRLEVITEIRKAFTSALATQKLIEKNSELIEISEKLITNLQKRVEAGKISPAEVSRAQIILNSLQIGISRLEADYDSAIFELTALINDPNLSIGKLTGEMKNFEQLPDYDFLYSKLESNPNLKRFTSEYNKQKAVIDLEESKSIPDLTVSVGYRRITEVKINTFLVGASIPLPIFDANQGSIEEAQIRLDQKNKEYEAVKNRLTLRLNLLYRRFGMLLSISEKIENESIPDAEESFKIISKGNLLGRFTILDVLDAERTLFEVQNQHINTLSEINLVIVEIEGLTEYNIQ